MKDVTVTLPYSQYQELLQEVANAHQSGAEIVLNVLDGLFYRTLTPTEIQKGLRSAGMSDKVIERVLRVPSKGFFCKQLRRDRVVEGED